MTSGTTIAKLVIFLGVIVLFVNFLAADPVMVEREPGLQQVSAWDSLEATLTQGPSFPTFNDPFAGEIAGNATYYPDGPTDLSFPVSFYVAPSFVGCANATLERQQCINTDDSEQSYVRFAFGDTAFQASAVVFNMTPPGLMNAGALSAAREVTFTISCRTLSNSSVAPVFTFQIGGGAPGDLIGTPLTSCAPRAQGFNLMQISVDYPTGIADLNPIGGFEASLFASHRDFLDPDPEMGILDVGFIRVDILFSEVGSPCVVPSGAWFPALDEVACAIIGFGQLVWRSAQWVINGIIFLSLSFVALTVFFFSAVAGLVLGLFNTFAFLLAIPGAPAPVQFTVAIFVLGALAFLFFTIAWLVRGTGPV